MYTPHIVPPRQGDRPSASKQGQIIDALSTWNMGPGMLVDSTGIMSRAVVGPPGIELRHFELKDDLTPGNSAAAYQQAWDGSAYAADADSQEFDVYDIGGLHRGRGRDKYGSPHNTGSCGTAVQGGESGEWEIVWMQPAATLITGLLTGDLATTDTTFQIDGVTIMLPIGGIITDQDPAADMTIHNILQNEAGDYWNSDDNGYVRAVWNEAEEQWDADYVACKN